MHIFHIQAVEWFGSWGFTQTPLGHAGSQICGQEERGE